MESRQSRKQGKAVPWVSLLAALLPAWRSVAAVLLVVLVLVPYASGAFLFAGRGGPNCGMQCCKGSKVCFCRRPDKHGRQGGPGWSASSKCPEGCAQLPAVSRTAAPSLVALRVGVSPIFHVSPVPFPAVPPRISSETRSALFERPPPTLQVLYRVMLRFCEKPLPYGRGSIRSRAKRAPRQQAVSRWDRISRLET